MREKLSIRQKALAVNIDDLKYGAFAEIGAGQEVVRHFFQAGGAAGTVAKSTSAYDMTISDKIYGSKTSGRYVCQSRLECMLDHEYTQLVESLASSRPEDSTFFAFCNTVSTRAYKRKNECHGWLGIRFQKHPKGAPCDVIIHLRLLDNNHLMQQEIVGHVGTNLIYAAFNYINDSKSFIESLTDNIPKGRVEIDMINFDGQELSHIDNRLANFRLVSLHLTKAIMFKPDGNTCQPSDALYKKPTMILRGSFRPVTLVNMDMLECGSKQFAEEPKAVDNEPIEVMEITLNNLANDGEIKSQDFLDRIDLLSSLGYATIITNFPYHHEFAHYISRCVRNTFSMVIGVRDLKMMLEQNYSNIIEGGIFEAFGQLFAKGGRLYIYPERDTKNDTLITAQNLVIPNELKYLYQHLITNNYIIDLNNVKTENLHIYSREVLNMIRANKPGWEQFVPNSVANLIKQKGLWQSLITCIEDVEVETCSH